MVRLIGRCLPIICMPRKKRQSLPIGEQRVAGTRHHQDEVNKLFVRRVESIRVTQQGAAVKRLPLHTLRERQQLKKTKSKAALSKPNKADDTEFDCETHISERRSKRTNRLKGKKTYSSIKPKSSINEKKPAPESSRPRSQLEKLFKRTKSTTKSASIVDPSDLEDDLDETSSSVSSTLSSDWSTTTYPDSQSSEQSQDLLPAVQRRQSMPAVNGNRSIKHRSCVDSFYLGREHIRQSPPPPPLPARSSFAKGKVNALKTAQLPPPSKPVEVKSIVRSKQVLQNVRKMIKDQHVEDDPIQRSRQRESVRL